MVIFKPEKFSNMNFLNYDINFEQVWNAYHFKNSGFDFPFFKPFEKCVRIHPPWWISVQPRIIIVTGSVILFPCCLNKFTCEHTIIYGSKSLEISEMPDRYALWAKLLKKKMKEFFCCFQWFWWFDTDVSGKKKHLHSFLPFCRYYFAIFWFVQ